MTSRKSHVVILFKSVSYALKAEKILKREGLPHKLIPVPKQISSDCGVCLKIDADTQDSIVRALSNVDIEDIVSLED